jgi:hypothetical protein
MYTTYVSSTLRNRVAASSWCNLHWYYSQHQYYRHFLTHVREIITRWLMMVNLHRSHRYNLTRKICMVTIKDLFTLFWDMTPCSHSVTVNFRGHCREKLQYHNERVFKTYNILRNPNKQRLQECLLIRHILGPKCIPVTFRLNLSTLTTAYFIKYE